jgi:mRNA interferase RelE/StbE
VSRRRRLEFTPGAARNLQRLPTGAAVNVSPAIADLAVEPYPLGTRKVAGTAFWRIRVGQLRVVYAIDEDEARVLIVRIARRTEITYRRLT